MTCRAPAVYASPSLEMLTGRRAHEDVPGESPNLAYRCQVGDLDEQVTR